VWKLLRWRAGFFGGRGGAGAVAALVRTKICDAAAVRRRLRDLWWRE